MQTILVAVDPQHDAGQVLARAAQLSAQHGAAVTVQHVVEDIDVGQQDVQRAIDQHARATLEGLVGAAGFATTPSLKVQFGVPHRCVNTIARELSADIILIGPGQPTTVMQRVFGSTADRIVRTASVPVLIVRNNSAQAYRSVAVAMDFSPLSEAALEAARMLAPDARIDLVHAYEVPLPFEQAMLRAGTRPEDAERFRQTKINDCRHQLADFARKHSTEADAVVLRGAPGTALVELSRSGRVDVIALGTQGRNEVAQALLGSVARRLLSEAGCDLLVAGHARH
ncbi:universal stress protein [Rhodoligotrophos defluvii]|uniref:universal stress protein n=1 Tax=Rhodoligotrophos defluvii TaxID=2561934 RepID=UPI0010C98363|nr:universal stress protein [Rhodoligotrophos defluvii]